jgi:hypothetical protein
VQLKSHHLPTTTTTTVSDTATDRNQCCGSEPVSMRIRNFRSMRSQGFDDQKLERKNLTGIFYVSAAPQKDAGIEPRTIATLARSKHSARSHPLKKCTVKKKPIFCSIIAIFIPRLPERTPKLQERLSALKRE